MGAQFEEIQWIIFTNNYLKKKSVFPFDAKKVSTPLDGSWIEDGRGGSRIGVEPIRREPRLFGTSRPKKQNANSNHKNGVLSVAPHPSGHARKIHAAEKKTEQSVHEKEESSTMTHVSEYVFNDWERRIMKPSTPSFLPTREE